MSVDTAGRDGELNGMPRIPLTLIPLALAVATSPAAAQNEPFRVINRTAVPATALHVARSGQDWSANLLRNPLAPGAFFALRPGEGAGCRFDVRLVLQGGEEIVAREADICAQRIVEISGGPPAPPRGVPPRVIQGPAR
jgi:hypothetical protein